METQNSRSGNPYVSQRDRYADRESSGPAAPRKVFAARDATLVRWLKEAVETSSAGNLLDVLATRHGLNTHDRRGSRERNYFSGLSDWAGEARRQGGVLTRGLPTRDSALDATGHSGGPGAGSRNSHVRLDDRLLFWPSGILTGTTVGILSSRLTRDLESWPEWFAAIRAIVETLGVDQYLVTVPTTTAAAAVERAATLFDRPVVRLIPPPAGQAYLSQWLRFVQQTVGPPPAATPSAAWVSPCWHSSDGCPVPLRWHADQWLCDASDRVIGVAVRQRGRVVELLRQRLRDPSRPSGSVQIWEEPKLIAKALQAEFLSAGAVPRCVCPEVRERIPIETRKQVRQVPSIQTTVTAIDWQGAFGQRPGDPWDVLTHCTRRRYGPWPHQSPADYWDDLLLRRSGCEHSARGALTRIVRTRRLWSSSDAIRGGQAVVSFSATTLPTLAALHSFQPHRGHWDFEPYAIAIRGPVLRGLGARPVIYGDAALWSQLPERDRPYYQRDRSVSPRGQLRSWQREQEWRVQGDIDLSLVASSDAWILVPSDEDAAAMARFSCWPVLVWGALFR